jgi:hypothetical protein
MGLGLVLMAVAAIAVPAWAAGDEEAVTEATGDAVDAIPAAVTAERERIDKCMTEHGFGPDSQAGATVEVPAPGQADADEIPPLPEPSPAFKKAAEECGLPAPGEVMMAVRGELEGRGGELCALPAPPPLRGQGQDEDQDAQ